MTFDHTLRQSPEEQHRAKELSLTRTKPPVEAPGYDVQRFLGTGAYGEVWVGVDRKTGRRVAVKYFTHRGGIDWPLLSREVEKLVFLSADRYVVQLLDVGWDADPPFYVMEYIPNGSLDERLRERGILPVSEATEILREVATGLLRAHAKGVLHCDLKPANVLLDQENKPVLADFGQSRMTSDQRPALGTLFYMAPEQARLDAIPDAQWDVYALGALFYCMVIGQAPYRTEAALQTLDGAANLSDRLAQYRQQIESSPRPTEHRRVPGVDRSLADIIDRCLAVDPAARYGNVQSVLDALKARTTARSRLPLRLLGLVGPLLILVIATLFGMRGYHYAMRDSESFMSQRVGESNQFAAKFAARSIEGELSRYFRVVNRESEADDFLALLREVGELPVLTQLNQSESDEAREPKRRELLDHPQRLRLHAYLQERLDIFRKRLKSDPTELKFASIIALDPRGTIVAVAYASEFETRSVGRNFAWRSYFHGGPADLAPGVRVPQVQPVSQTSLSSVFQSTTEETWKVALSTPVYETVDDQERLLGVLALTINLGDFAYFRSNRGPERFAVLVDGRPGPNQGTILQHPLFDEEARNGLRRLADYSSGEFHVPSSDLQRIREEGDFIYYDPLAQAPGGEEFAGEWIAAGDHVRLPDAAADSENMLVLVQENLLAATAPVKQLGARLVREAMLALGGIITVVGVLWYLVLRVLEEPRGAKA